MRSPPPPPCRRVRVKQAPKWEIGVFPCFEGLGVGGGSKVTTKFETLCLFHAYTPAPQKTASINWQTIWGLYAPKILELFGPTFKLKYFESMLVNAECGPPPPPPKFTKSILVFLKKGGFTEFWFFRPLPCISLVNYGKRGVGLRIWRVICRFSLRCSSVRAKTTTTARGMTGFFRISLHPNLVVLSQLSSAWQAFGGIKHWRKFKTWRRCPETTDCCPWLRMSGFLDEVQSAVSMLLSDFSSIFTVQVTWRTCFCWADFPAKAWARTQGYCKRGSRGQWKV